MSAYRLPNVPYTDRLGDEPFYIYSDTSALLQGKGFSRMTPLTRRLSSHLQGHHSNHQQNGYKSVTSMSSTKGPASKPRLMLMGQRRYGGFADEDLMADGRTGAANLRLRVWSFTRCLLRRHYSWSRPPGSRKISCSKFIIWQMGLSFT